MSPLYRWRVVKAIFLSLIILVAVKPALGDDYTPSATAWVNPSIATWCSGSGPNCTGFGWQPQTINYHYTNMDWHSSSVNGVSAQSNLAGTGYSASGSAWATAGNAPSVYASAFATSITSTPVGTWSSASETYWYSVMDASPSAPYYAYVQVSYGGTQSRSSSNGNFALSTGDQLTIGGFGEWTNLNSLGQSTGGLVVIGQWYEVQMDVSVEALVTNSNGGSASVTDFIDPEISLSPGWAASHPDASIQFSDLQPSTTPEPTSILLLGTGLAGLGGLIRRKLRV